MTGSLFGFNPDRLTPAASLNRVCIVDLPGLAMDTSTAAAIKGQTAHDLLSAHALVTDLHKHATALGVPVDVIDAQRLPILFDECFESPRASVRAAAEEVARRFGMRLGYLVATLKRGDAVNRQARPEWNDSHWAHWAAIQRIWLGGGLVSGQLGQHMLRYAQAVLGPALAGAGVSECALQLAASPSNLALIGAARSIPANASTALVFDFGQSRVKRACGFYANNALTHLQLMPALPAPWLSANPDESIDPVELGEYIALLMAQSFQLLRQISNNLGTTISASIASYVIDGQPVEDGPGIFGVLRQLPARATDWLSQSVSRQVGMAIRVNLLHDGTAAARAYAGEQLTAVIMLGTALGVGFVPSVAGVRPFAPRFTVEG